MLIDIGAYVLTVRAKPAKKEHARFRAGAGGDEATGQSAGLLTVRAAGVQQLLRGELFLSPVLVAFHEPKICF